MVANGLRGLRSREIVTPKMRDNHRTRHPESCPLIDASWQRAARTRKKAGHLIFGCEEGFAFERASAKITFWELA